jgi:hypothetical protein
MVISRFISDEVDPHVAHAGQRFEGSLDGFDLIGAVHAGDPECGLRAGFGVGIEHGPTRRVVVIAV